MSAVFSKMTGMMMKVQEVAVAILTERHSKGRCEKEVRESKGHHRGRSICDIPFCKNIPDPELSRHDASCGMTQVASTNTAHGSRYRVRLVDKSM